jgi:chromosome segregation ATPase
MAESADVRSIEGLRDVKAALAAFAEDARIALDDVAFEIRRMNEWVGSDMPQHWRGEQKRWEQKLAQARAELARKRLSGMNTDRKPDTSQEEKKVRQCEARIEEALRKQARCKQVIPELQRAIQEYHGPSMRLADQSSVHIPRALARLDRLMDAIEQYAQVTAPSAPRMTGAARGAAPDEAATKADSMARGEVEEADGEGAARAADPESPREGGEEP